MSRVECTTGGCQELSVLQLMSRVEFATGGCQELSVLQVDVKS